MTAPAIPKPKIFLAYEIGGIRAEILREVFDEVFPESEWARHYGLLPKVGPEAPRTHEQVRLILKDGCAVFDLAGEKCHANNGLNLNVLFELGMALGMQIPTFAITYDPIATYKDIHGRTSDLDGCGIYGYDSRASLQGQLESAKQYFLDNLGLTQSQSEDRR